MKKFEALYKQIIAESRKTNPKKSIIKQESAFEEQIESIQVNGKNYDVKFIKYPNGLWNYQLNQKYEIDCDPQDPSCDVWYPDLNEVQFEQNFNSFEDAKQNAIADIQNQLVWNKIN